MFVRQVQAEAAGAGARLRKEYCLTSAKTVGSLTCVRCGETKNREQFVNDRTRPSGKFPWCKPCVTASRAGNRTRVHYPQLTIAGGERMCPVCDASLEGAHAGRVFCNDRCKDRARNWRTFGLAVHEYRQLIEAQGGKCPICRRNVKRWVLDHNHETGETTGATCTNCNTQLLAYCYHKESIAENLRAYLENPPVRSMLGERRYVGPESISNLDRMWGWKKRAA